MAAFGPRSRVSIAVARRGSPSVPVELARLRFPKTVPQAGGYGAHASLWERTCRDHVTSQFAGGSQREPQERFSGRVRRAARGSRRAAVRRTRPNSSSALRKRI